MAYQKREIRTIEAGLQDDNSELSEMGLGAAANVDSDVTHYSGFKMVSTSDNGHPVDGSNPPVMNITFPPSSME
jgi:hypothetical protein